MSHTPSLKEVVALSKRANLIPVCREILADFETPLSAYLKIEGQGPAYLLESVEGGEQVARYSFLGTNPKWIFESKGNHAKLTQGKRVTESTLTSDPLTALRDLLKGFKPAEIPGLPRFAGGLVGFTSYDLVRFFEPIGNAVKDDLKAPDLCFMLSEAVVIFDHVEHRIKVVVYVDLTDVKKPTRAQVEKAYKTAARKVDQMVRLLQSPRPALPKAKTKHRLQVRSNLTKQQFVKMVRKTKEYIKSGDIIQGVLSQRFGTSIGVSPFQLYRALRSINPSPYMFYLNFGGYQLVGASPEILVRCEDSVVTTRPIAGTRPRGKTEKADIKLAQELEADPKEQAEHIMLVDLGRNDLGRVCRYGTVEVKKFMEVERYSHVMHLVSDVEGQKRKSQDAFDCLTAAFPAGTVSGAPKVRAMQIIEELEPTQRGPYAGCVGYMDLYGNMDTCITIRTIFVKGKKAYVQAGAGIVADSKPEKEYQETCNKAAAMLEAIRRAHEGLE